MGIASKKIPSVVSTQAAARIISVEDDDALRSITTVFLTNLGYQVQSFENADLALEFFKQDDGFDLLLSDVVLPGTLNGVQLGAELQRRKASLKLFFVSGYCYQEQPNEYPVELGDEFLQKPFELRNLAARIETLLLQ